jgi:sec-independent protein translocase protein TatA
MRMGMPELLIILAIVILLFGARRLPDIGSGLAKSIKGFRKGIADDEASGEEGGEDGEEKGSSAPKADAAPPEKKDEQ